MPGSSDRHPPLLHRIETRGTNLSVIRIETSFGPRTDHPAAAGQPPDETKPLPDSLVVIQDGPIPIETGDDASELMVDAVLDPEGNDSVDELRQGVPAAQQSPPPV